MSYITRKPLRVLAAGLALAAGVALAVLQKPASNPPMVATVFDAPRPLASFPLIDTRGQTVTSSDLKGHWSWLFFGFTSCPDVCPATLGILATAVDKLDPSLRPEVYLISVDPERDTPERLGQYVSHFNADFQGLTGPPDQIKALADSLYAAFAKVPLDNGDYTMDHFAGIYFVNDNAEVVAISTTPHIAAQLASDYTALRDRR